MLFGGMLRAASKEDEALLDIVSQRYENVSNRCCFAADEAKRLIDEVFAKAPEQYWKQIRINNNDGADVVIKSLPMDVAEYLCQWLVYWAGKR